MLRHLAVFDITAEIREAADRLLARWRRRRQAGAPRARAALEEIVARRAAEIGPLQFGDGGIPGVPSTVGARAVSMTQTVTPRRSRTPLAPATTLTNCALQADRCNSYAF